MKQKGFTLIELLVTMGIIAVLTGMAVFNFNQARIRARDVQRKSDLSQLVKSMELYKNDTGSYPPSEADFQRVMLEGGYFKAEFVDPKGSDWSAYQYAPGNTLKSYYLMACLENNADSVRATADKCLNFPNGSGGGADACKCGTGTSLTDFTGVMYIVSNP
jgi:prepilin-type N-terminal cleavage/methylation domain-containing protein